MATNELDSHGPQGADRDKVDYFEREYARRHGCRPPGAVRRGENTSKIFAVVNQEESDTITKRKTQILDKINDSFYKDDDLIIGKKYSGAVEQVINGQPDKEYSVVMILEELSTDDSSFRVVLMGCSTEDVKNVKHQIKVASKQIKPTRRKNREFAESPAVLRKSPVPVTETPDSNTSFSVDIHKTDFLPYEGGLSVYVCKGSIEEFTGDGTCIVNPTNDRYKPAGHISQLLVRKGGTEFEKALDKIRSKTRKEVGECRVTLAGDLLVNRVIHLVCPDTRLSPSVTMDRSCKRNVFKSILACMKMAEDKAAVSKIVFPFIYTGKLGRSVKMCCLWYAYAILEFSRKRSARNLKQVYFVSNNSEHVKDAVSVFRKTIPQKYNQLFRIYEKMTDLSSDNTSNDASTSLEHAEINKGEEKSGFKTKGEEQSGDENKGEEQSGDENKGEERSGGPYTNIEVKNSAGHGYANLHFSNGNQNTGPHNYQNGNVTGDGCVPPSPCGSGDTPSYINVGSDAYKSLDEREYDISDGCKSPTITDEDGNIDYESLNFEKEGTENDNLVKGDVSPPSDDIKTHVRGGDSETESRVVSGDQYVDGRKHVSSMQNGVDCEERDTPAAGLYAEIDTVGVPGAGLMNSDTPTNPPETPPTPPPIPPKHTFSSTATVFNKHTESAKRELVLENFGGKISVSFKVADIRDCNSLAIVCPVSDTETTEDVTNGNELIAASIKAAHPITFSDASHDTKLEKMLTRFKKKQKYATFTKCSDGDSQSRAKYILHMVVPTLRENVQQFRDDLDLAFNGLMKTVKKLNKKQNVVQEFAIPFFGLNAIEERLVETVCGCMAESLHTCITKQDSGRLLANKISIVSGCPRIISLFEDAFQKVDGKTKTK